MRLPSAARSAALSVAASVLILGVSACGGDAMGEADKAALISKVKADPEFKDLPEAFLNCMADVVVKYGEKSNLQSYLDGKIKLDAIQGVQPSDKEADAAAKKCAESIK
ncbi:hypothetical protein GCM10022226_76510 [Sphaerisporangium flaviroseum]|uniref:Uncharacterized protein n=1 Tax=Sphaerisporangium flaviroseum TaxID=509199 RepID=A0ABP7JDP9_9ACTN